MTGVERCSPSIEGKSEVRGQVVRERDGRLRNFTARATEGIREAVKAKGQRFMSIEFQVGRGKNDGREASASS